MATTANDCAASSRSASTGGAPGAKAGAPVLSSSQLFQGSNTVRIEHAGQSYILRLTRENKLILTK